MSQYQISKIPARIASHVNKMMEHKNVTSGAVQLVTDVKLVTASVQAIQDQNPTFQHPKGLYLAYSGAELEVYRDLIKHLPFAHQCDIEYGDFWIVWDGVVIRIIERKSRSDVDDHARSDNQALRLSQLPWIKPHQVSFLFEPDPDTGEFDDIELAAMSHKMSRDGFGASMSSLSAHHTYLMMVVLFRSAVEDGDIYFATRGMTDGQVAEYKAQHMVEKRQLVKKRVPVDVMEAQLKVMDGVSEAVARAVAKFFGTMDQLREALNEARKDGFTEPWNILKLCVKVGDKPLQDKACRRVWMAAFNVDENDAVFQVGGSKVQKMELIPKLENA